jgi:hypothetical protein
MSLSSYRRKQTVSGLVYVNDNGGYYQPGRMYQLPKKIKVAEIYLGLMEARYPLRVSITEVAHMARVGWDYARLVVHELEFHGFIQVPERSRRAKNHVLGPGQKLSTVHEMFLLCLRTLDPARPLYSYVQELNNQFQKTVSIKSISNWFHKRWDFRGNLKRANLVPLDKWKLSNKIRYFEFVQIRTILLTSNA